MVLAIVDDFDLHSAAQPCEAARGACRAPPLPKARQRRGPSCRYVADTKLPARPSSTPSTRSIATYPAEPLHARHRADHLHRARGHEVALEAFVEAGTTERRALAGIVGRLGSTGDVEASSGLLVHRPTIAQTPSYCDPPRGGAVARTETPARAHCKAFSSSCLLPASRERGGTYARANVCRSNNHRGRLAAARARRVRAEGHGRGERVAQAASALLVSPEYGMEARRRITRRGPRSGARVRRHELPRRLERRPPAAERRSMDLRRASVACGCAFGSIGISLGKAPSRHPSRRRGGRRACPWSSTRRTRGFTVVRLRPRAPCSEAP